MVKIFNYINLDNNNYDYGHREVIIYGRAVTALHVYMEMKANGINVIGFVDSYAKEGDTFAGLKVYTFDEIFEIHDIILYIAVQNEKYKRDILYMLEENLPKDNAVVMHGVVYGAWEYDTVYFENLISENNEKIDFIKSKLSDDMSLKSFSNLVSYRLTNDRKLLEEIYDTSHWQYFPIDGMLKPCPDEVFVDAGGFDGLTTAQFAEWTAGNYKKSIIFEADETMYEICREMMRVKNIKNVSLVKKAVYSHDTMLCFDSTNYASGSGNVVEEGGTSQVLATSIDNTLREMNEKASFIKMDIEGAEMEALKGCEKTIEACHPKLAISIYHRDNDLWEIPYYLMKKYPFYKFYVRHYTPYTTETVLYATE